MRTPLKKLDNAEAVANGLGCTGVDDALRLFEDETAFGEKLAALGWADRGGYLLERMTPILSQFARQERELLRAFLSGRTDFQQVYPAFLAFLGTADTGLEPGPLLKSLGFYEREAYALLMEELNERPAQELVRLLGFGLAEGDYEREIARELVASRLAGEVCIYGYDPYIDFSGSGIEPWVPAGEGSVLFDFVLARWVLHHLPPAERWASFLAAARSLAPGGWLLIQEEGDFRDVEEWTLADRLLELLLSSVDVLNTRTFVAEWHEQATEESPAYYLGHLTAADVVALESGFGFPFERRVRETGPGVFGQTLFVYRRLPS